MRATSWFYYVTVDSYMYVLIMYLYLYLSTFLEYLRTSSLMAGHRRNQVVLQYGQVTVTAPSGVSFTDFGDQSVSTALNVGFYKLACLACSTARQYDSRPRILFVAVLV